MIVSVLHQTVDIMHAVGIAVISVQYGSVVNWTFLKKKKKYIFIRFTAIKDKRTVFKSYRAIILYSYLQMNRFIDEIQQTLTVPILVR